MKAVSPIVVVRPFIVAAVLAASANSSEAAIVKIEAESGSLGSSIAQESEGGVTYIRPTENHTGFAPGTSNRIATYQIRFPEAGQYELFARVYVGPNAWNDDSFLVATGFGLKSLTNTADWLLVNNLASAGYTNPAHIVLENGTVGTTTWKWINISRFTNAGHGRPLPFLYYVPPDQLTQTFQISTREDGFRIDAIAFGTAGYTFTVADLDAGRDGTPPPSPPQPEPQNFVFGTLIQFNDNGGWCWYQDERAVIDHRQNKLVTGSVASGAGLGGSPRNGAIEAVICDLNTRTSSRYTLSTRFGCDDHNAPAFLVRPDGKYLAIYAGHNNDMFSYYRIFDGVAWSAEQGFDWNVNIPGGCSNTVTYSNPYFLAAENLLYNFARCDDYRSPHFMISTNYGDTWVFGGQIVTGTPGVGYNSGYFKYCGNGIDRIDFICTEAHPRDVLTSIYHGYISNGMSFKTDGTVVDTNIFDQICPVASNFQLVFSNGTVMPPGMTNYRCWNSDVQRYPDGRIACIIHARINQFASGGYPDTVDPNHSFFYCRYDGTNWRATYLCQAGYKLYSDEADYVGLGCLDPHDPNVIYISTKYDPRAVVPGQTDTNPPFSQFREIWKGITTDGGLTFQWTPITFNSACDNVRPIMPAWDQNHRALLWWRGTYYSAHSFDTAIVGIIETKDEFAGPKIYVDANTNNTFLVAPESPLVPSEEPSQWHLRPFGNGNTVFASADTRPENAPPIKTAVHLPASGTYDIWVNFWGSFGTNADWRIAAGFSTNQMQVYRQKACQIVWPGEHNTPLILTNNSTNFLYQAYIGRISVQEPTTVWIYVDDHPIQTGTANTQVGDTARTWYDGISFAYVDKLRVTSVEVQSHNPFRIKITWTSKPVEHSLFTQRFTVQRTHSLHSPYWVNVATNILSQGYLTSFTDQPPDGSIAFYRIVLE